MYEGQWTDDSIVRGSESLPNGERYEGCFNEGVRCGEGILISKTGLTEAVEYGDNGEIKTRKLIETCVDNNQQQIDEDKENSGMVLLNETSSSLEVLAPLIATKDSEETKVTIDMPNSLHLDGLLLPEPTNLPSHIPDSVSDLTETMEMPSSDNVSIPTDPVQDLDEDDYDYDFWTQMESTLVWRACWSTPW